MSTLKEQAEEQLKKDYNILMGLGCDDFEIMMVAESFSEKEPEHPLSINFIKLSESENEYDYVKNLKCAVAICTVLLNQNKKE
jgi:hypothetical protein